MPAAPAFAASAPVRVATTPAGPATPGANPSAAAPSSVRPTPAPVPASSPGEPLAEGAREAFLAAVKSGKVFFYNAVVAQAYRIEVTAARITFTFLPNQKVPRAQCDENRVWLEALGEQVFGRMIPVHVAVADAAAPPPAASAAMPSAAPPRPALKSPLAGPSEEDLRQEALSDPTVQALLEIFPVERTRIEEM